MTGPGAPRVRRAMVADRYGPVSRLTARDVEIPTPAADEVLVRVRAAAISPGDRGVITGVPGVGFDETASAFEYLDHREEIGKVVITFGDS